MYILKYIYIYYYAETLWNKQALKIYIPESMDFVKLNPEYSSMFRGA